MCTYLAVARASGSMVTFFFVASLLFTLRPLTSTLNEIVHLNLNWRRIHIDLVYIAGIFAVIHSIAQTLRIVYNNSGVMEYEQYFYWTGVVLWFFFVSQFLPFFSIRLFQGFSLAKYIDPIMKTYFRQTHIWFY